MCDLSVKTHLALILLFINSHSAAEMYKWVDEDGNTYYSQSAPVSNDVNVEIIAPPPPVNTTNAKKNLQQTVEKAESLREERLVAKENKAKEEAESKQLEERCLQLKERLYSLQVRPRANKKDEAGNLVRMSEEERQEDIKNTEEQIKENCK